MQIEDSDSLEAFKRELLDTENIAMLCNDPSSARDIVLVTEQHSLEGDFEHTPDFNREECEQNTDTFTRQLAISHELRLESLQALTRHDEIAKQKVKD